jgi:hypothetical protein
MEQRIELSATTGWSRRDALAATLLFLATAAFVLWQNSRLAIIWDLSYLLDSSARMALGQHPYRDFPFVHPPLTFLLQAAILRLTGRVYFHQVLYAAAAGAFATVLTWRLALHILRPRIVIAWSVSLLLAAPLTVLGIYSIFPHPFYDCDAILSVLIALLLLQSLSTPAQPSHLRASAAGVALVIPVFFKQNIGLPFLLIALVCILLLLAVNLRKNAHLLTVLVAALATLLAAALLLHLTAGLGNYYHWTVQFAAQRRLPGLHNMLTVFAEPALLWQLPAMAAALLLLRSRAAAKAWVRALAFMLLASPFLWTLLLLALHTDTDDRADDLIALWPLVLALAATSALVSLLLALKRRTLTLRTLLPVMTLAAIFGTLLSQQLWGSTYALWPLLVLLLAELFASLTTHLDTPNGTPLLPALTFTVAATLLVCGGLYAVSAERLTYVQLDDAPLERSTQPALRGMATRGPWLPSFDQLLHFAAAEIPQDDGILLIPGEDPFYFATGRTPRFPLLLFDNTTDPYSPKQIAALARTNNIRWLILKRSLQLNADPMQQRDATLQLLAQQFTLYRRLDNYDVYRRTP